MRSRLRITGDLGSIFMSCISFPNLSINKEDGYQVNAIVYHTVDSLASMSSCAYIKCTVLALVQSAFDYISTTNGSLSVYQVDAIDVNCRSP